MLVSTVYIVLHISRENVPLTAALAARGSVLYHLLLSSFRAQSVWSLGVSLRLLSNNIREFMKLIPQRPQGLPLPRGLLKWGPPLDRRTSQVTQLTTYLS